MKAVWEGFWLWIEEKRIMRRGVLLFVLYLTGYTLMWSIDFAEKSQRSGGEIAMILGAIWGPMGILQGAVFAFYSNSRTHSETQPVPVQPYPQGVHG